VLADKGHNVVTITPDAMVVVAVARMNDHHIGALVVVDARNVPVGIFSERDVLTRIVGGGRDPARTRVREVMTCELVAITPDLTVGRAMALITKRRCRHLPVLVDGLLIGLVSSGDLTRWLIRDQEREIHDLCRYIHGPHVHVAS
jgi:CBS domain-containing protein